MTGSPKWLVGRAFDLTWFFGGAALSLIALALFFAGAPIVALWWVWLLAFDGPHIAAAFTRTYLDPGEWRRRPGLLLGSLLTFAIGPLFLLFTALTGSPDPFLLFLGFATVYGYYHVVRQHYGFVALYNTVNKDWEPDRGALDRWTLYAGCWTPYVYFLVMHPKARELARLPPGPPGTMATAAGYALIAIWLAVLARFVAYHLRRDGFRVRTPKVPYLFATVLLYGFIYFAVARLEPVYRAAQGPDQQFLLLSIVIVVFHNVQYVGLVWFHNRNRYGDGAPHGAAGFVSRGLWAFAAACMLFSLAIYATFACSTGVFPACQWFTAAPAIGAITLNQIGLCLWWGLAMNHYFLDQKIWRVSGDETLRRSLRLVG